MTVEPITDEELDLVLHTAKQACEKIMEDETSEEYFAGFCEDAIPKFQQVRACIDLERNRNAQLEEALWEVEATGHNVRPRGEEMAFGRDPECPHCLAYRVLEEP